MLGPIVALSSVLSRCLKHLAACAGFGAVAGAAAGNRGQIYFCTEIGFELHACAHTGMAPLPTVVRSNETRATKLGY